MTMNKRMLLNKVKINKVKLNKVKTGGKTMKKRILTIAMMFAMVFANAQMFEGVGRSSLLEELEDFIETADALAVYRPFGNRLRAPICNTLFALETRLADLEYVYEITYEAVSAAGDMTQIPVLATVKHFLEDMREIFSEVHETYYTVFDLHLEYSWEGFSGERDFGKTYEMLSTNKDLSEQHWHTLLNLKQTFQNSLKNNVEFFQKNLQKKRR